MSILKKRLSGQAPDKGLYFPEQIPMVDKELIDNIEDYSNEEIAFKVIEPYVGDTIPDEKLLQIVVESINFPIPLVQVNERYFFTGIISWAYACI